MPKRRPTVAEDVRDLVGALGFERATQLAQSLVRADKHLHVRCSEARMERYRQAAKSDGVKLAAWVIAALDKAAG